MAEIKSESSEITPAILPGEPKVTPSFYAYNIFPEHLSTVLPVLIVLEGKDKLLPTSHHNAMVHIFDLFRT